ncbi:MAG: putative ABC transporter permease [Anaerovoracaceae bacterium]
MENYLTQFPLQYPVQKRVKKPKGKNAVEIKFEQMTKDVDYARKYKITSYILLFFIFASIGWCWEVSLHLIKDGVLVNRGVLMGPWLPIYGSGGVMILVLLRKWVNKPVLTFFLVMFLCTGVEYVTSWWLEYTKGMKWWDYSGYFLNINGRVCLLGAVTFAIGGTAFIYFIAPRIDNLLLKLSKKMTICLCCILVCLFAADWLHSQKHPNTGDGVTGGSFVTLPMVVHELMDRGK